MEYIIDDKRFVLSYQELKEEYLRFCKMSDNEFLGNLPAAAHLACIICYVKEIPAQVCLADTGVIHELIHLIHIPDCDLLSLAKIRKLFKESLKLV